ncbi:hypothetical protein GVAV_001302 [Gurleya vavrai]
MIQIQNHNIKFEFLKGLDNGLADFLSREFTYPNDDKNEKSKCNILYNKVQNSTRLDKKYISIFYHKYQKIKKDIMTIEILLSKIRNKIYFKDDLEQLETAVLFLHNDCGHINYKN